MAHARRFRFGVEMQGPFNGLSWAESARRLETWGYSTLFVPDHFHEGFGPIAAMATAAVATTTLRVGPMVFACDFRHPAVLARELATIDILSEGRLEIGLGAGYNTLDYSRSGIRMDPAPVRVDRLIEHAAVLKALFSEGPVNFAGEYYTIADLEGTPKPFRAGGPPIIVAGGGRRILRFAATSADIVGINPSIKAGAAGTESAQDALPARIDQKVAWIVRPPATLRRPRVHGVAGGGRHHRHAAAVGERLSPRFSASAEEVLQSRSSRRHRGEIADRLVERRTVGDTRTSCPGTIGGEFAPSSCPLTGVIQEVAWLDR
jgi:probable F420-dependent oxidoreductase